ncbi:hypothetical protein LIA77_10634 [Sarocladium implicatum]|nr:hypothetical protein LIA77_10634 [Sarocladium implicatum]
MGKLDQPIASRRVAGSPIQQSEKGDDSSGFVNASFALRKTPAGKKSSAGNYTLHLPDDHEGLKFRGDEEPSPSVRRQASIRKYWPARPSSDSLPDVPHLHGMVETDEISQRPARKAPWSNEGSSSLAAPAAPNYRQGSLAAKSSTSARKRKRQTEKVTEKTISDELGVLGNGSQRTWAVCINVDRPKDSTPVIISSSDEGSVSPSTNHSPTQFGQAMQQQPLSLKRKVNIQKNACSTIALPEVSQGARPTRKAAAQATHLNQKLCTVHPRFTESKRGRR